MLGQMLNELKTGLRHQGARVKMSLCDRQQFIGPHHLGHLHDHRHRKSSRLSTPSL
jgi:hypothetical protein